MGVGVFMKDNKKIIIILAVALVLIIINVYSVTNNLFDQLSYSNSQLSNLQYQLDNLRSDFENLQGNIKDELKLQSSILGSYNISYDNADAKALTGDITIKITPKDYSESTSATVTLGDKVVPLSREGNTFAAVISVPVDIIYSQFIVSFKDGEAIRNEVVASGDIGFVNELFSMTDSTFFGEMSFSMNNKHGYHGQVQVFAKEGEKSFSDIKLFAIKNGSEVIWETEDFFYNKEEGNYTTDIDKTFSLKKEDRLHLALEMKDSYGFTYKTPVFGTEIYGSDGVTGASEEMNQIIYDAEGKVIEFKNY